MRLKAKAFKVVALLSLEDMINYARILGKYANGLSGTQVEALLYQYCEEEPQKIIDVSEDRDLNYKILLHKLLAYNFIIIKNGKYMNGNEPVGINENYAIQWLKDPKNSVIITQWTKSLDEKFDLPSVAAVFESEDKKESVEKKTTTKKKTTKAKTE